MSAKFPRGGGGGGSKTFFSSKSKTTDPLRLIDGSWVNTSPDIIKGYFLLYNHYLNKLVISSNR